MYGYWKIVLRTGTAVALLAGTASLLTTQASAQFGFEGIIRGAISHECCSGGFSRRHHGRVHESRHSHRSKGDEADDDDSSKGKDDKSVGDTKADVKPASAVSQPDSRANQGQPQTAASSPSTSPSKPNTDIPAFTPSR